MATVTYDLHALIEEARRRARQRRWTYAGLLALLAGAGIWGGLALTSGSGTIPAPPAPPGYHLVKARGTVQHALLAGSFRSGLNGYPVGKAAREHVEVWLDRKAGFIRQRGCWFGRCSDEPARCVPYCASSAPLLERYWPVDTAKFVRRPGTGTFRGRQVIWIGKLENTFAPAYRNGEWIALDPRTHDAVAYRMYGTTDKPAGQILGETWVVRRFADVAPNRFWFAVKNKGLDVRFVRLQPTPLYVPGRAPVFDLRHTARIVVGRLAGATIFAAPRRDGSWRMFSVGKDGTLDGAHRIDDPHTLRVGLVQLGHGSLFTSRAYLVVAGNALEKRRTKLFLVYADGSRQRIRLISAAKAVGAGFHYYLIPRVHHVRGRRATGLELVRRSRVLARQFLPVPYEEPKQPGPLTLQAALRVLDF